MKEMCGYANVRMCGLRALRRRWFYIRTSAHPHISTFILTFVQLLICLLASAQDSCHLRITLLTCTPGEELYSTFGHSALRITDSVSNTDVVYNYGTFNFAEPGFYTKFIRGKLLYYLSTESSDNFMEGIRQENR